MKTEKQTTETTVESYSRLNSLLNKLRIAVFCLIAGSSCATSSTSNVSTLPKKAPEVEKIHPSKQNTSPYPVRNNNKNNQKETPSDKKEERNESSGGRGYYPEEDIPCDELDLSEPGACVQV